MDINDLLIRTTTAVKDVGLGNEIWIKDGGRHARKKSSRDVSVTGSSDCEPLKVSRKAIAGKSTGYAAAAPVPNSGSNVLSSKQASLGSECGAFNSFTEARLVIDYMLAREVDRCQIVSEKQGETIKPCRNSKCSVSQLAAERAKPSSVSSRAVRHYLCAFQYPWKGLQGDVRWENYPEVVFRYRQTLQVCDIRRDLISRRSAGHSLYLRGLALRIIEAALDGKALQEERTAYNKDEDTYNRGCTPERQDNPDKTAVNSRNEIQLSFQTATESSVKGSGPKPFVLDKFLSPSSSSSSESLDAE